MLFVIFVFFIICVSQTIRIFISYRYINGGKAQECVGVKGQKLFILIPVLNEQNVIEKSVKHFSRFVSDDVKVVYITSDKENRDSKIQISTLNILQDLNKTTSFDIINCPIVDNAVMAHQLNYAIKEICDEEGGDFYFSVYNVDCRINEKTIKYLKKYLCQDQVIQQYSHYDLDKVDSSVLWHIAAWQSRWSMHFELGRLLFDKMFPWLSRVFMPFHYVIGHGLSMHYNIWLAVQGFPENETNEDAFLGYILHLKRIGIKPMPILEKSDIAKSISVYIQQQSVWFNGPFFAWKYMLHSWEYETKKSLYFYVKSFFAAGKLFSHAIYWLCGPLLIWIIIPLCIILFHFDVYYMVLWCFLAIYHCYVLNILSVYLLKDKCLIGVSSPPSSILAYILHCFGPLLSIYKTISGNNGLSNKYKTDK